MKQEHFLIFIAGFFLGVLACILIACIWGPRAETLELDLYSGQQRTIREFLWYYRISLQPDEEHTGWAKEQQEKSITPWYVMVSSTQRSSWFGPLASGDACVRDIVRSIYDLSVPQEEKVKLLHEYWSSLDNARSIKPVESVFEQWHQRLTSQDTMPSPRATSSSKPNVETQTLTLQYRVSMDAVAPSQFVALHHNGMTWGLNINWKIGADKKRELDQLIAQLEKDGANGREFIARVEWIREGVELDVYEIEKKF